MKKKWYLSKAIQAGIAIVILGFCKAFDVPLPYEAIITILAGYGVVGIRAALK